MPTSPLNVYPANPCQAIYGGRYAEAQTLKFANSLTVVKGTVVGIITASGLVAPYLSTNSDGTQVAKGISQYDVTTDVNGLHTIAGGELGATYAGAPVLFSGDYQTSELTGLDAGAVANLGRLVSGTVAGPGILALIGG
jgi:hypothetical protein